MYFFATYQEDTKAHRSHDTFAKKKLADCAGTGPSTTYDIGAYCPINISALKKSLERKGHRYGQVERTTHKLIVIARDTLRLYEPSTLFDTHALMIKR